MKSMIKLFVILTGVASLTACVEETVYYSDHHHSGYTSSYQSAGMTGYNRDYYKRPRHQEHRRNNQSSEYVSSQYSPDRTADSGYSSSQTPAVTTYSSSETSTSPNSGYGSSSGSSVSSGMSGSSTLSGSTQVTEDQSIQQPKASDGFSSGASGFSSGQ